MDAKKSDGARPPAGKRAGGNGKLLETKAPETKTPETNAPETSAPEVKRQAAALRYNNSKDRAPRILAKGQGEVADRIVARAREHGIPVYEDSALVGTLMQLELDTEIPPELYRVVASVLSFVYRLDKRFK